MPETARALKIRNQADQQFLAVEQQHRRIVDGCRGIYAMGMPDSHRDDRVRLTIDVDLFLHCLQRLLRVCELVRRSRLPAVNLRRPIRDFENQTVGITPLRNVLEHLDGAAVSGHGGIGYGLGPDGVNVTYDGAAFDTAALLESARRLHLAIRSAVDPIAVLDVHGGYPIIELESPAVVSMDEA
ncbi:hypothetical protein [Kitasatospora kifunensis]|uniref:Uncharacterized protein n=1 Tax=Kitasatospora kifunensis TaxID=58351 RepID=A0A7W7R1S4_KITKI|nr:hypothetical protein [Kitasatospora kifunensis]MBB4923201.1 hypothetical protein [Kitasatospora kifunensis]